MTKIEVYLKVVGELMHIKTEYIFAINKQMARNVRFKFVTQITDYHVNFTSNLYK